MPKGVHSGHLCGTAHPRAKNWRPPCPEDRLRHLYEVGGMSQAEIAQHLGVTLKRIQTAMRKFGIRPRPQIKRNQSGAANANWKGSDATYQAFHKRVEVARGTPLECQRCGDANPALTYDWANLTGNYADINDYERMCRSCHRQYDSRRWGGDA